MSTLVHVDFKRHAEDLRRTWQSVALYASLYPGEFAPPRDKLGMSMLSILAHNYDEAMPALLRIVFPGFRSIGAPFLCSAARIAKTGHVMADMISKDGQRVKNQALFRSTKGMEREFRGFADRLELADDERIEMFEAIKRWVVADYRLDPHMDPADPDAKRLTVQ